MDLRTLPLEFNNIVSKSLNHSNYKVRFMESVEAEAVKLFSNTYLAMRELLFLINYIFFLCKIN